MLISVIVPVYKVELYLSRCVDSILNQTFSDFELILVDDGSPDHCGKICDEYAKKDNRIHVIHKQNGGLSDARNAGIDWCVSNSNNQWVTFIDSDDWIHPRYLETLYEAAIKHNSSISVCNYIDVDEYNPFEIYDALFSRSISTENLFLRYNTVATVAWGKLYKRNYFEKTRYPFGKINEDEYVTYKLLFQNNDIAFVDYPLYYYFNNSDGITKVKWTPKNLDAIEALMQQCKYFKKESNRNLYTFVVNKYIWVLKTQYESLIEFDDYDQKYEFVKLIRKELRKCLKQKGVNKSVSKDTYLYAIAYPKLIKLFYFYKRLKKKVSRMMNI